jgi:hypothetical protein
MSRFIAFAIMALVLFFSTPATAERKLEQNKFCADMAQNIFGNVASFRVEILSIKAYYDSKTNARIALQHWLDTIRRSPSFLPLKECKAYYNMKGEEGGVVVGNIMYLLNTEGWKRIIPLSEYMEIVTNPQNYS